jgi:hypothetical protein
MMGVNSCKPIRYAPGNPSMSDMQQGGDHAIVMCWSYR